MRNVIKWNRTSLREEKINNNHPTWQVSPPVKQGVCFPWRNLVIDRRPSHRLFCNAIEWACDGLTLIHDITISRRLCHSGRKSRRQSSGDDIWISVIYTKNTISYFPYNKHLKRMTWVWVPLINGIKHKGFKELRIYNVFCDKYKAYNIGITKRPAARQYPTNGNSTKETIVEISF